MRLFERPRSAGVRRLSGAGGPLATVNRPEILTGGVASHLGGGVDGGIDSEFHTVTTLVIVYFYIPQKNLPERKLFYTFEDPHQPIFTNTTHVYYKATMSTHHITLCIRHVFTACLREMKITSDRQLCKLFTIFLKKRQLVRKLKGSTHRD